MFILLFNGLKFKVLQFLNDFVNVKQRKDPLLGFNNLLIKYINSYITRDDDIFGFCRTLKKNW